MKNENTNENSAGRGLCALCLRDSESEGEGLVAVAGAVGTECLSCEGVVGGVVSQFYRILQRIKWADMPKFGVGQEVPVDVWRVRLWDDAVDLVTVAKVTVVRADAPWAVIVEFAGKERHLLKSITGFVLVEQV